MEGREDSCPVSLACDKSPYAEWKAKQAVDDGTPF